MTADYTWSFTISDAPPPDVDILINEVDADTPGTDVLEFIELYDGGRGNVSLNGLVIVFYNGTNDQSYRTIDLTSYQTDANGYFVLGNAAVPNVDLVFPNGGLQNGPDAVALYVGSATDFPNGTAVTTTNLLDALVYDTGQEDDEGLLVLLNSGQPQVDENGRGSGPEHSNQRCPNGEGGQRNTAGYRQNPPTPGAVNNCLTDDPPRVTGTVPADGAVDVPVNSNVTVTFSEDVTVSGNWFEIACAVSGVRTTANAAVSGGPRTFTINPNADFARGEVCNATIFAAQVSDLDTDDPPDNMTADYTWSFTISDAPPPDVDILINEVDADTPGSDTAEFIELYDGGRGNVSLNGLVVVFYNGADDRSYRAIDLTGYQTNGAGYFVLGNAAVPNVDLVFPNGGLQNGPDAVALYVGATTDFPNGTAVTTTNLLDALVYDTGQEDDEGLLTLLNPGQPQVDENGRGDKDNHSNQRCPNGAGGQRNTAGYRQNPPTPGAVNNCLTDDPPAVAGTVPADGAVDVPVNSNVTVTFSEDVTVSGNWFEIACAVSGVRTTANTAVSGGPRTFTINPNADFARGESCTGTIFAAQVRDVDTDDPPDAMAANHVWRFTVTSAPPPDTGILINEVDADTPGSDTAEFIELYDGGRGNVSLNGLVVVFYNGSNDQSYRAIELTGYRTNAAGYFVLGNAAVPNVDLVFPNGGLQNGPDAVALYVGSAADFPNGTTVTTANLLDALVYDTGQAADEGLLVLLNPGQPQVNENGRRNKDNHSNQRCPNGAGGQRNTDGYQQNPPTPGAANDCVFDHPPQVTAVEPPDGATGVAPDAALSVTFSEAVTVSGDWFAIVCTVSGAQPAQVSGGPVQFTLAPAGNFAGGESCTVTLFAAQVIDQDGDPTPLPADFTWRFSIGVPAFGACGDPATFIHTVQGDGAASPLAGSQGVIVEGVVVGDFQGADGLRGFFVQEEDADADDNPATSEGLFVYDADFGVDVTPGDVVRVQGDVAEYNGLTELTNVRGVAVCGTGAAVTPARVELPIADLAEWEQAEGMLVTLPQTLTVTGLDNWGRFGEVDLAVDGRLFQPTQIAAPGPDARAQQALNARRRILLDDGSARAYPQPLPPYLGPDDTLRAGDTLAGLTGVLTFSFDAYRIHPTGPVSFARQNARSAQPPDAGGRLTVASFNLLNYFNGDGQGGGFPTPRGADSPEEFARQRAKLISAILALEADVLGVMELENDGYGPDSAIRDLVDGLNAAAPAGTTYAFVDPGLPQLGGDEITVGLIYRTETVATWATAVTLDTFPFDALNRQPLAQTFTERATGERFTVVVNHFKSKGSCPAGGENADQGDGQGCWNALRVQAADALADWLSDDPTGSGDADLLILGDLNAYAREDPLAVLAAAGYANLAATFGGAESYSYLFEGQAGALDHALASPRLAAQVTAVATWRINADEPRALDYNDDNQPGLYRPDPFRASDHDPLLVGLNLAPLAPGFTSDSPVRIGRPARFTNTTTGPGPFTFTWDFGDGSPPVTAENPVHLYRAVGEYVVTLTVATAWGETAVARGTAVVEPAVWYFPVVGNGR